MFKNSFFKTSVKFNQFVEATARRAARTFFQTLGGFIVAGLALSDINWKFALSVSTTAAIGSICTSIASIPKEATMDIEADELDETGEE